MTLDAETRIDPITAEIVRAGFISITDEMKTNLMRTAYNVVIYEAQDFTVGLFDAEGRTISIGLGLPMFIGGLSDAIKAKIDHFGPGGIRPGDILLTNDPYIMGSHLNHMIFTMPVFHDGELIAFSSSMAHWLDVGGVLGATTHDIYSEGIQVPIVKIFNEGVQNEELTRMIAANVRFPDLAMGDLRAQVAAIRTGERRLGAMLERYGADAVRASIDSMFAQSEAKVRATVAAIPDGEYGAEAFMDDDGVSIGVPVPIKVKVVVSGDEMTIDMTDISPQVGGYFNSGATAGRSAAQVAFKCLTSPSDAPINDGALRPLNIVLPPGRVVSATKPAAMRWWMIYPMTVVDCVFKALADAIPEAVAAGHHADLTVTQVTGVDPSSGRFYMFFTGVHGGGWGAHARSDGQSATVCINDGDTHNMPIEVIEGKYPITVESYALRQDSGGPGRYRGGLGTEIAFRLDAPGVLNSFIERTQCPPWGLAGAEAGLPNRVALDTGAGGPEELANGKIDSRPLQPGDGYVVRVGGGGGYGDPYLRPEDDVLRDVNAGYVSPEGARRYGVVVSLGEGGEFVLDRAATSDIRNRSDRTRSEGGKLDG